MSKDNSNNQTNTEEMNQELIAEGENMVQVMEFISSCNSLSELIDKLSIENIRLWHILDDTVILKRELEKPNLNDNERVAILEKIAKKSFENIETVKRRSVFKKAIDEVFALNVKNVISGKNVNICNENKSYGR